MAEDGGGVYKRLLLPHMRILNNPPAAHTPEQKRSKAAPNPPARPLLRRGDVDEAETEARPHAPSPAAGDGLGRSGGRPRPWSGGPDGLRHLRRQCRWRERPASGKVPVPSGGGWWELCAAQLMNLKLFLWGMGYAFAVRAWYGGWTSAMGFLWPNVSDGFLVSVLLLCDGV